MGVRRAPDRGWTPQRPFSRISVHTHVEVLLSIRCLALRPSSDTSKRLLHPETRGVPELDHREHGPSAGPFKLQMAANKGLLLEIKSARCNLPSCHALNKDKICFEPRFAFPVSLINRVSRSLLRKTIASAIELSGHIRDRCICGNAAPIFRLPTATTQLRND
jgi:hypothetical protein